MPQPYLVPVRPTFSRITQRRGVFGSTSTCCVFPLMVRRIICVLLPVVVVALTLVPLAALLQAVSLLRQPGDVIGQDVDVPVAERLGGGCHVAVKVGRSEEHTSELQSHVNLVC